MCAPHISYRDKIAPERSRKKWLHSKREFSIRLCPGDSICVAIFVPLRDSFAGTRWLNCAGSWTRGQGQALAKKTDGCGLVGT